ncbi:MAG: UMP kinase, partial [Bacteroidota bacterium]
MKYKRILLKLSGESLMGDQQFGIEPEMLKHYAAQIKELVELGVEVAVVIGGGNIFRGLQSAAMNIDRVQGDYMGMMATVINGMALQSALEKVGVYTRLSTAIEMRQIAEPYIRRRVVRHLEKGRVVIFGEGSWCAFFCTFSSSSLRGKYLIADF